MLILLPPSEGKTAPARGRPVDLAALTRPDLTTARSQVLDALQQVSARPDAPALLGVGASLSEEVARNTALRQAHAAPAAKVYTGVLYAAADLAELTGTARRRANTSVRIVSALWGVLSPADKVPAYRLSMGTSLPGTGPLARHWSRALGDQLTGPGRATDTEVIIDCRSAAYLAAWKPPAGTPWLTVRVVAETDGVRTVVSHHAKHTRGLLTHHLLTRPGSPPRTISAVVAATRELIGPVLREVNHLRAATGPDTLELVLS
ncbi:YaaA family protein [Ruania zhangjianzhongii]|uniref:YaaA family protein n=1 Tax=Ruania zhangjianzhongii TaxID=2603206 RepID=UPI0011C85D54|nr:peroxide stress protein YaaA [Ruania zhangjianzhongii]